MAHGSQTMGARTAGDPSPLLYPIALLLVVETLVILAFLVVGFAPPRSEPTPGPAMPSHEAPTIQWPHGPILARVVPEGPTDTIGRPGDPQPPVGGSLAPVPVSLPEAATGMAVPEEGWRLQDAPMMVGLLAGLSAVAAAAILGLSARGERGPRPPRRPGPIGV
jgi:hypothetical protein